MRDAWNIAAPSPDTQHTAHFIYGGEIRFGPPYFSLLVDNYSFGQRIFGDAHLWSPLSNLLAVQEWLTIDYSIPTRFVKCDILLPSNNVAHVFGNRGEGVS